jgi:hypothetical protein
MQVPGKSVSIFLLSIFILSVSATSFSQGDPRTQIEQSYEVILQIVIGGSDKAANQPLPANLSGITKQLRGNYQFAEYRLANTYVGRIANGGNFELKSISNIFGRGPESETPSFLEWSLGGLRAAQSAPGKNEMLLHSFRFGARIPIKAGTPVGEIGKQFPVFNYEPIGVSSQRITLAENTPTLLGSLSLPNTNDAMFLVLTLRAS